MLMLASHSSEKGMKMLRGQVAYVQFWFLGNMSGAKTFVTLETF